MCPSLAAVSLDAAFRFQPFDEFLGGRHLRPTYFVIKKDGDFPSACLAVFPEKLEDGEFCIRDLIELHDGSALMPTDHVSVIIVAKRENLSTGRFRFLGSGESRAASWNRNSRQVHGLGEISVAVARIPGSSEVRARSHPSNLATVRNQSPNSSSCRNLGLGRRARLNDLPRNPLPVI